MKDTLTYLVDYERIIFHKRIIEKLWHDASQPKKTQV